MAQLLPDCRLNYFWIGGSPNTGLPAQRMAEYSPPAIRRRCEELGLIEKRERQLSKRELIKKGSRCHSFGTVFY